MNVISCNNADSEFEKKSISHIIAQNSDKPPLVVGIRIKSDFCKMEDKTENLKDR